MVCGRRNCSSPSGSPEDPSDWVGESSDSSWVVTTGRLTAETMPVVTVEDRPSGLPIAMTSWPVTTWSESPNCATVRSEGASVSLMTARSVAGSVPVSSAA